MILEMALFSFVRSILRVLITTIIRREIEEGVEIYPLNKIPKLSYLERGLIFGIALFSFVRSFEF